MIVFMDIDGTIANATERFKKAGPEPKERGKEYSAWLQRVQNELLLTQDEPVKGMKALCYAFSHNPVTSLVYLTGRSEIYREVTEDWLFKHRFPQFHAPLLMRPKQNRQGNGILKERLIKAYLQNSKEDVIVIDDDYNGDIEEMCLRNGYTFLKARSGGVWK